MRLSYTALAQQIMTTLFKRHLPHYHLPDATYFVTFRLAGSLPYEVVARLEEERQRQLRLLEQMLSGAALQAARYEEQKRHFARVDALLDRVLYGPRWLSEPTCAQIVMDCLRELDPAHFHLYAFCVMCNHVHALFDQQGIPEPPPRADGKAHTALSVAMQLLKAKSAAFCNRYLKRRGAFWQHESYDHVVRNEREFARLLAYIADNPVKAGLAANWQEWLYTYINPELL